jgi:hypothetical protein
MVHVSHVWRLIIAAVLLSHSVLAEDWIEWPLSAGGNGRWYSLTPPVSRDGVVTWISRFEANAVSISTLEEDNFVRWNIAQGERAWIGLRGRRTNLAWSDGSPVTYMPGIIWNAPDWMEDTDYLFLNGSTNTIHWTALFASPHYGALLERANSPYEGPVEFMGDLLVRQLEVTNIVNGYFPEGATVEIRADVFGARPLALQWQLGGMDLAGQTNSILVVSNVVPNGSAYRLMARNSFGVASSEEIVLRVMPMRPQQGISWFQWPQVYGGNGHWYGMLQSQHAVHRAEDQARLMGGHLASFSDTNELNFAAGLLTGRPGCMSGLIAEPRSPYAWTDGTPVDGDVLNAVGIPHGTNNGDRRSALNITASDSYFLDFRSWMVAYPLIEVTNDPALLPPIILNHPPIGESYSNGSAEFAVHAVGVEPISYQWKIDGAPLAGETNSTYTMQLTTGSTGMVSVAVSNPNGTVESDRMPVRIFRTEQSGELNWSYWAPEIGGNGHWYASFTDLDNPLTCEEAGHLGATFSSYLVCIRDAAEWEWLITIWRLTTGAVIPLGLSDADSEGQFQWVDGSPLEFQLWAPNEPSQSPGSDFAYSNLQSEWGTVAGTAKFSTMIFERSRPPSEIIPVIISSAPSPIRMAVGESREIPFKVIAGAGSVFKWVFNGRVVSTNPVLTLKPASTNESGLYHLAVQNQYGTVQTAPISVTVLDPIRPTLRAVRGSDWDKFEIHFDFPADADEVELEYSYDLRSWYPWYPAAIASRSDPPYFETSRTDYPNGMAKFYRIKRSY